MNAKRLGFPKLLAAFISLSALVGSSTAADLSKIPRTIAKEPPYKTKPKYCLVVFGPEAKTRIWLVLDGDVLYVDKNGNGDLSEPTERVIGEKDGVFHIGKISEAGTTISHEAELRRIEKDQGKGEETLYVMWVKVGGYKQSAYIPFAQRPDEASILHFSGPLTMGLSAEFNRKKETQIQAFVGIRGLVEGKSEVATQLPFDIAPADIHPVADIEFPAREASEKPIKVSIVLKHRC
jgi:hypothetical protein